MEWTTRIADSALRTAEKAAQGFHAIPAIKASDGKNSGVDLLRKFPSVHRLLNVVGMVGGFATTQYMSNIIFGCRINGSDCEEIPKENVPAPLRFMHGIVKYNPFSDEPRDQWLKVVHQMLPAIGGAYGAVKGSEVFFTTLNEREKVFNAWKAKSALSPVEADAAVSFAQGKQWRKITGLTAWLSSASGLTVLYGMALNSAFMLCNGGKVGTSKILRKITGNPSELGLGVEKAIPAVLKGVQAALKDGSTEELAKQLVGASIEPLKKLSDKERSALVHEIQKTIEDAAKGISKNPTPSEIGSVTRNATAKLHEIIARTDVKDLKIHNTNGVLGAIVNQFPGMADEIGHFRKAAERYAANNNIPQRA